jgi:hypothetical protein
VRVHRTNTVVPRKDRRRLYRRIAMHANRLNLCNEK